MPKQLPWILCLVLGVLLVSSHLPQKKLPNTKMPRDFAEFGASVRWVRVDDGKESVIWKCPAHDEKDINVWAFTTKDRLVALLADGQRGVEVYHEGKQIASLPNGNKMSNNLRQFYVTGSDGKNYTVVDLDGDGEIDWKQGNGHYWIYQHGDFLEVDFTNRYERVKHLLDGRAVVLKDGRWRNVEQDGSNKADRPNVSPPAGSP